MNGRNSWFLKRRLLWVGAEHGLLNSDVAEDAAAGDNSVHHTTFHAARNGLHRNSNAGTPAMPHGTASEVV